MRRWSLTVFADAPTIDEAFEYFKTNVKLPFVQSSIHEKGYVHPDGRVLPDASAPASKNTAIMRRSMAFI